jgi:predicted transcriptional regulator
MAAMGDIIISVKPEHARNIIVGRKTVELRRRFADTSAIGRWMLIYSSRPEKALIGAVRIANVRRMAVGTLWRAFREQLDASGGARRGARRSPLNSPLRTILSL